MIQLPIFLFQLVFALIWQPDFIWPIVAAVMLLQFMLRKQAFLLWMLSLVLATYWMHVNDIASVCIFIVGLLQFYIQSTWSQFELGKKPIANLAIRLLLIISLLVTGSLLGYSVMNVQWHLAMPNSMMLIIASSVFAALFLRSLDKKKSKKDG